MIGSLIDFMEPPVLLRVTLFLAALIAIPAHAAVIELQFDYNFTQFSGLYQTTEPDQTGSVTVRIDDSILATNGQHIGAVDVVSLNQINSPITDPAGNVLDESNIGFNQAIVQGGKLTYVSMQFGGMANPNLGQIFGIGLTFTGADLFAGQISQPFYTIYGGGTEMLYRRGSWVTNGIPAGINMSVAGTVGIGYSGPPRATAPTGGEGIPVPAALGLVLVGLSGLAVRKRLR